MKRSQKIIPLNKTILLIMMIGYSAFLVLMLMIDVSMLQKYQHQRRSEREEVLASYLKKTEDSVDAVNALLYDLYSADENFDKLQKETRPVFEYSYAYELRERLKQNMSTYEDLSGYYIFYDNLESCWYAINSDYDDYEYSRKVKEQLRAILGEHLLSSGVKGYQVIKTDGEVCLALYYTRGRAAICGIHMLRDMEETLKEELGADIRVAMVENGVTLGDEELSEQFQLVKLTENASESIYKSAKGYQIFGRRLYNSDLWVVMACKLHMADRINLQQILLFLITAASVTAVCILWSFLRREVVWPLRRLTLTMNRIRKGENQELPENDSRIQEFIDVNETLKKMVRELEEQKLLTYEEIIEKQKAQMQYLQLQLKPHFYLNGLKTINALAINGQTDRIQDLAMTLSVHLRYLLSAERELIPLRDELKFAQNYLALQKHMTDRQIRSSFYAEEDVLDWPVPMLAVQTFVENSVKYASLGSDHAVLELDVRAELLKTEEGDFLDLTIQDNGQGYDEEALAEINGDPLLGSRCVGINNIKRRCRLIYKDRAEYLFENNGGAFSELILPWKGKL